MTASTVATRLNNVRRQLADALAAAHRPSTDATLLAVSKTKPAEDIRAAYEAGQRAFGENYLQEALDKQAQLASLDIEWHFIGPLQSNKTREAATHFNWVHSIDRLKIAKRLNDQRPDALPPLNICLQVNISRDPNKSGVLPEDAEAVVYEIIDLPRLCLRGLMTLPSASDAIEAQRRPFCELRELRDRLQQTFPQLALDTLSMGMSNDVNAAILEGATLVRIGTAIFGARQYGAET